MLTILWSSAHFQFTSLRRKPIPSHAQSPYGGRFSSLPVGKIPAYIRSVFDPASTSFKRIEELLDLVVRSFSPRLSLDRHLNLACKAWTELDTSNLPMGDDFFPMCAFLGASGLSPHQRAAIARPLGLVLHAAAHHIRWAEAQARSGSHCTPEARRNACSPPAEWTKDLSRLMNIGALPRRCRPQVIRIGTTALCS